MKTKTAIFALMLGSLLVGPATANDRDRDRDDRRHDQRHDQRYDQRDDHRDWRHVPPARYRGHQSYREGYAAGYREAAQRCRRGHRHGRWYQGSRGDWFFGADERQVAWVDRYDPLRVASDR